MHFLSPVAFAQQTLGSLNGAVTDPSGAMVSGAAIELVGDQNGIRLSVISKKDGTYQFQNLPVGIYRTVRCLSLPNTQGALSWTVHHRFKLL